MQVLLLLQSDPATRALHSADGEDFDDADTGGLLAAPGGCGNISGCVCRAQAFFGVHQDI